MFESYLLDAIFHLKKNQKNILNKKALTRDKKGFLNNEELFSPGVYYS